MLIRAGLCLWLMPERSSRHLCISHRNVAVWCRLAEAQCRANSSLCPPGSDEVNPVLHGLADPSDVFCACDTLVVPDTGAIGMQVR